MILSVDNKIYIIYSKKKIQQCKMLPLLLIMEYQKDMDLYYLMEKKIMKKKYKRKEWYFFLWKYNISKRAEKKTK